MQGSNHLLTIFHIKHAIVKLGKGWLTQFQNNVIVWQAQFVGILYKIHRKKVKRNISHGIIYIYIYIYLCVCACVCVCAPYPLLSVMICKNTVPICKLYKVSEACKPLSRSWCFITNPIPMSGYLLWPSHTDYLIATLESTNLLWRFEATYILVWTLILELILWERWSRENSEST